MSIPVKYELGNNYRSNMKHKRSRLYYQIHLRSVTLLFSFHLQKKNYVGFYSHLAFGNFFVRLTKGGVLRYKYGTLLKVGAKLLLMPTIDCCRITSSRTTCPVLSCLVFSCLILLV